MPPLSPTQAGSDIAKESSVDLPSGIKIRFYRNDPFRAMSDIVKFLTGLKIGELYSLHTHMDNQGWFNCIVAYRELRPDPIPQDKKVDPIIVLFDTVVLLRDVVEEINKLSAVVQRLGEQWTPAGTQNDAIPSPVAEAQVSGA